MGVIKGDTRSLDNGSYNWVNPLGEASPGIGYRLHFHFRP